MLDAMAEGGSGSASELWEFNRCDLGVLLILQNSATDSLHFAYLLSEDVPFRPCGGEHRSSTLTETYDQKKASTGITSLFMVTLIVDYVEIIKVSRHGLLASH